MKTTYYILTAREILVSGDGVEQAAGGARRLVFARRPGRQGQAEKGDNVIHLADWKAARAELEPNLGLEGDGDGWTAAQAPAHPDGLRRRQNLWKRALLGGELLATLCLIGTMVLLMARILTA